MNPPRREEPASPLQPGEEARGGEPEHGAATTELVAEFEGLDEAKRVERMAEAEIVARLAEDGFDPNSKEWKNLADALARYGLAVLVAWGVRGKLAAHAAKHGGVSGHRVPHLQLDFDSAQSLAGQVLVVALAKFRTRSLTAWSPTGGASLKTYFIGRCLMELAGVQRTWSRREHGSVPREDFVDDGRHVARADEQAEAAILADEVFAGDTDLRAMFELAAQGYKLAEIAEKMGQTPNGVRSRMYRFRKSVIRRYGEDAHDA